MDELSPLVENKSGVMHIEDILFYGFMVVGIIGLLVTIYLLIADIIRSNQNQTPVAQKSGPAISSSAPNLTIISPS